MSFGVRAVIVVSSLNDERHLDEAVARGLAVVSYDRSANSGSHSLVDHVSAEHQAGYLAADHLIAHGHRRLAFLVPGGKTVSRGDKIDGSMSTAMLERDPEWFLPGIGGFPMDRANLLTTDDAFVESVLLGANTELLGEFLWREFPTDRRGTPIGRFWPRPDGAADIKPIHQWSGPLGSHTTAVASQHHDHPDPRRTVPPLPEHGRCWPRAPNWTRRTPTTSGRPARWTTGCKPVFTLVIDPSTRVIAFPVPAPRCSSRSPRWRRDGSS